MIIDLFYHRTRTVIVVTNVKEETFGMIIGVIRVRLIIMVIFVPKKEKLVQDGILAIMAQLIHITMLAAMQLVLVELVDLVV